MKTTSKPYENNNPFKDATGNRLPSRAGEFEAAGLELYWLLAKSVAAKHKIAISATPVAARYGKKRWYELYEVLNHNDPALVALRTNQGWE